MTKKCIFCGRTDRKITKEHIFPNWLGKMFPAHFYAVNEGTNADGTLVYNYKSKMFQRTANCVCGVCNNGWMSDIENEAKPILTKMLRGKNIVLDKKSQKRIANWATKTILVLNHDNPAPPEEPYIPKEHYDEFYKLKGVHEGNILLLGQFLQREFMGGDLIATNRINTAPKLNTPKELKGYIEERIRQGARTYGATLSLGNIVFQLAGSNIFKGTDYGIRLTIPPEPMRVLNPHNNKIHWPLKYSVEYVGGLDAVHVVLLGGSKSDHANLKFVT